MTETPQVDRKDLKIQALLERVSSLTTQYENQAAEFRVEITVLSEELRKYTEKGPDEAPQPPETPQAPEASADDSD